MANSKEQRSAASRRTRAAAFIGLAIALIAVSAWVTIPLGPVPFTLQMFAIALVICLLPAPWSIAAIISYVAIGALGVPVFSGFRGGVGVLLGPTGGFLIGYLIGVPLASLFLAFARDRIINKKALFACEVAAGLIFTAFAYLIGWLQFTVVAGISPEAAFLTSIAPFIIPDVIKVVIAATCAQPIARALTLAQ